MSMIAPQITVCTATCLGQRQRKHPRYGSFVRGIHRWPVPSYRETNGQNFSVSSRHCGSCNHTLDCTWDSYIFRQCKPVSLRSFDVFYVGLIGPVCGDFTGRRWIPLKKGLWHGAVMFSFICAWIKSRVNNREAGIWDAIAFIMTSFNASLAIEDLEQR